MYTMDYLVDHDLIPYELAKNLNWVCNCGGAILQNKSGTKRRCGNPSCPYHLAERADFMLKYFGYKGIGPSYMRDIIKQNNLKSHFDVLDENLYINKSSAAAEKMLSICRTPRPVYLYEIAQLASIPNIQSSALEIFKGFHSFEDFFKMSSSLFEYSNLLISAQKYFIIKGNQSNKIIEVMITGGVNGFRNKEEFINYCNTTYGHVVFTKYIKHKKLGADVLICDNPNNASMKLALADKIRSDYSYLEVISSRSYVNWLERLSSAHI